MAATGKPSALAAWNDGAAKSQILDFVARVTEQGGPEFVPPAERIATFENDGTLWCEQPLFVQVFFLMDRARELAGRDPTLNERQPFKALLEQDFKTLMGLGKQALFELVFATHSGMREEEFDPIARNWLTKTRHPKLGQWYRIPSFGELALQLVALLEALLKGLEHIASRRLLLSADEIFTHRISDDGLQLPSLLVGDGLHRLQNVRVSLRGVFAKGLHGLHPES